MTRKLNCVWVGVFVVLMLAAAQASATVITVDDMNWTMTMKYNASCGLPPSGTNYTATVDYNINGTPSNDVALSTYTNTLTSGFDARRYDDDTYGIGLRQGGDMVQQTEVSWKFEALAGGAGVFNAFTFNPAYVWNLYGNDSTGTTISWAVAVNDGSPVNIATYKASSLGGQYGVAVGTIDLMDSAKSYYIGVNASTVEIICQVDRGSDGVAWYEGISCRVPNVGTTALEVNASVVPEPSGLAMVTASALALLAYAWRRKK